MRNLSPIQELGKRAAETMPGISAAAAAVGLEDHRRMLLDHSAKLRADYAYQQKLLGNTDYADSANEADSMPGDITITGDIYGGPHPDVLKKLLGDRDQQQIQTATTPATTQPVQAPVATTPASGVPGWLKTVIAGAGVLGSGAAGAAINSYLNPPAPVVTSDPDGNTQYELQIVK